MRVENKVYINRTADEAFAFIADRGNEPVWRSSSISVVTDRPPGPASTGKTRFQFMGRPVNVEWEIAEYQTGSALVIEYSSTIRGGRDCYRFVSFGSAGVTVHTEIDIFVGGLGGLISHARRSRYAAELHDDMHRVKDLLEDR